MDIIILKIIIIKFTWENVVRSRGFKLIYILIKLLGNNLYNDKVKTKLNLTIKVSLTDLFIVYFLGVYSIFRLSNMINTL